MCNRLTCREPAYYDDDQEGPCAEHVIEDLVEALEDRKAHERDVIHRLDHVTTRLNEVDRTLDEMRETIDNFSDKLDDIAKKEDKLSAESDQIEQTLTEIEGIENTEAGDIAATKQKIADLEAQIANSGGLDATQTAAFNERLQALKTKLAADEAALSGGGAPPEPPAPATS